MNEEEFRRRFREALGEPPQRNQAARIERTLGSPPSRPLAALAAPIAATLLILIVGGFAGWRLLSRHAAAPVSARPTPTISAQPTNAVVDPASCRLPVVVFRESGPPGDMASEPGFVDTQTGTYDKDTAASIAGLPGGGFEGTAAKPAQPASPSYYDGVAHRWLPVSWRQVAPDGRSYVWTSLLPAGSNAQTFQRSELHRYDLTTGTDQILWTYAGSIDIHPWVTAGIVVDTVPPQGGQQIEWRIDPQTGAATQLPPLGVGGPLVLPGDMTSRGFQYGVIGADVQGHPIYTIGSRAPGEREWVFYESSPGQRVTIYKGTHADATGFDPDVAFGDATGIWFSDFEMHGVWHWDLKTGLHKIPVAGLPGLLAGPHSAIYVNPAGPCMAK